jgi:hypothetical protein
LIWFALELDRPDRSSVALDELGCVTDAMLGVDLGLYQFVGGSSQSDWAGGPQRGDLLVGHAAVIAHGTRAATENAMKPRKGFDRHDASKCTVADVR